MTRLSMASKRQIIETQRAHYNKARKKQRTQILTSLEVTTDMSRGHLARVLRNGYCKQSKMLKDPRGRKAQYGMQHKKLLEFIWMTLFYPSSRRLKEALPDALESMKTTLSQHYEPKLIQELLGISHGTMDRLLRSSRQRMNPFGISTTKPGSLLINQIPIRRGTDWDDSKPLFVEIDLVAHCGDSTKGEFLYTLDCTDIASSWTECRAIRNKARTHTLEAMQSIKKSLPFPLLGIDSDNGSEFINSHFFYYCRENNLVFTRSRSDHSNDSCYGEQKNWSVVRRFMGYERFEGEEAVLLFNRFYEKLRTFNNFFLPSQKLLTRERIGNKVRKKHDRATTPYRRLMLDPRVDHIVKQRLSEEFSSLDLLALRQEMDELLGQIQAHSLGYSRTLNLTMPTSLSKTFYSWATI